MSKIVKISLKKISLIGVIMAGIMAGIFYWNYTRNFENSPSFKNFQEQERKKLEDMGSPDDYTVVEPESDQADQARYVENKKVGLMAKVPSGWTVEKVDHIDGDFGLHDNYGVVFFTSDIKPNPKFYFIFVPIEGCLINMYIRRNKEDLEFLRRDMVGVRDEARHNMMIVEIDGRSALKRIYGSIEKLAVDPNSFMYIITEVPSNDKIYSFEGYISSKDRDKCSQEFDEFLETVKID